jgi:hypothetical protein
MSIVLDGTSGITTPDLESAGPISGTTGTFSGAVQASGVATNIYPLVSATAVTASGTAVDFTGIPSWVKRITVMFALVSTNGASNIIIQLGDAGGIEATGYSSRADITGSAVTTGYAIANNSADRVTSGSVQISNITGDNWVASGAIVQTDVGYLIICGGDKTLSAPLTQIRITTVAGTATFDAGTINIMYEG